MFLDGDLSAVIAAMGFVLLFPTASFLINRRLMHGRLSVDRGAIALLSGLVFTIAVLCEASINPLYEWLFGHKLWEYRLLPLHDGNVSALGVAVWTAYGVHLSFFNQTLDRWLSGHPRRYAVKAMVIGCEAPLLWEVLGNGYFILTVGEFYAYYLPGDLFHLTSFQVVPFYIGAIYLGLRIYEWVQAADLRYRLPFMLYPAGLAFLMVGVR